MSFDFSTLETKANYQTNNPGSSPPNPSAEDIYNRRVSQMQNRVIRFFGRSGGNQSQLQFRVEFLETADKDALVAAVEGKGYSCVEANNVMTINLLYKYRTLLVQWENPAPREFHNRFLREGSDFVLFLYFAFIRLKLNGLILDKWQPEILLPIFSIRY